MDWFRFHTSTLNSAKVQELPDRLFKAWVNFMCVARIFDGVLPNHREIAFRLRCSPEIALKYTHELKKAGLVDEVQGNFVMHDWEEHQFKSDDAAGRKREWRTGQKKKSARDMSQLCPVVEQNRTEQRQNRTEQTAAWPPEFDFEVWFGARLAKHPIPGRPQIAHGYAIEKVWSEFAPFAFDASHDAWCEYWAGKDSGIPNLATFISEDWWKRAPPEKTSKSDQRVARYLQRKREEESGDHDAA